MKDYGKEISAIVVLQVDDSIGIARPDYFLAMAANATREIKQKMRILVEEEVYQFNSLTTHQLCDGSITIIQID